MRLLIMLTDGPSTIAAAMTGVVASLIGKNIPVIYIECSMIMILLITIVSLSRDLQGFLAYESESLQDTRTQGLDLVSSYEPL